MVRRKKLGKDTPMLTTAIVADMLGITPDRLRTYDSEKLIHTHRVKTGQIQRRLYTENDLEWLLCAKSLVKAHKMSISSIKILLQILSINPSIILPKNEIGNILYEMSNNPNFKSIVKNF